MNSEIDLRFSGIYRLYGQKAYERFQRSHILILGIGGVGSWVAESMARSAIGEITLVDPDEICQSNVNRQIHALNGNFSKFKTEAMSERLLNINPNLKIHCKNVFFSPHTSDEIFSTNFDFVVEAMDSLKDKCHAVVESKKRKTPIIISGGAAGKKDPSLIFLKDLGLSREDMLLMRMRKKLRRQFSFPKGKKTLFDIPCVYSEERHHYLNSKGETCLIPEDSTQTKLDCQQGMGTASFMTGTFAFHMTSYVLNFLANEQQQNS